MEERIEEYCQACIEQLETIQFQSLGDLRSFCQFMDEMAAMLGISNCVDKRQDCKTAWRAAYNRVLARIDAKRTACAN